MKHYYIKHPRNFYNEYWLFSVEAGSDSENRLKENGFERITRKAAETKCYEENYRRKYDRSCSGYAPSSIDSYEEYLRDCKKWCIDPLF